ncbi:MAG: SCP2 sterol-binding domain-containing protein [Nitrospiraceae bacterium]
MSQTIRDILDQLPGRLDSEAAEGVTAVYQFELSDPGGGRYYLVIDDGTCSVTEGNHPDPDVTLAMSGADALGVLSGNLSGQAMAMTGRLSVSGDIGLALQLKSLFPSVKTS